MDIESLNLANLGAGAAVEKWGEELQRVAENILDPNTEATAKRELLLRVALKPTKERRDVEITISVSTKLAAQIAVQTRAFVGMDRQTGQVVIAEHNTNQLALAFAQAQERKRPLVTPTSRGQFADELTDQTEQEDGEEA